nr:recombinase family protein [Roseivivax lentus]
MVCTCLGGLRKRRATIECLNFKFEETPEGEFIETIMAAQGALERKQNGRQVAQKMKARMQSGYWVHNAPVGYRYKSVKGHGKLLTPDEPHASVVREAIEGFAIGRYQSQVEVQRFLETKPYYPHNNGGKVLAMRVTDLLKNPIYTGHICSEVYELNWLRGQHEPLISMETYDKVQKRLASTGYAPERKNTGKDFVLRGFATCGDCSTPLRSSWSKGARNYYAYYSCHTKDCDSYGKSIPRDKIKGAFEQIVRTLQPSPKLTALARVIFAQAWEARLAQAKDTKRSIKRQVVEIEKQIEKLVARIMDTSNEAVISAYEKRIKALEQDRVRMKQNIDRILPKAGTAEEILELSLQLLSNPWKIWKNGNLTLRRTLLRLAFTEGFSYHRNSGHRTPEISLPFKALGVFQTGMKMNGAAGEN